MDRKYHRAYTRPYLRRDWNTLGQYVYSVLEEKDLHVIADDLGYCYSSIYKWLKVEHYHLPKFGAVMDLVGYLSMKDGQPQEVHAINILKCFSQWKSNQKRLERKYGKK